MSAVSRERNRHRVAEVAPRPGKIWIEEDQPDGTIRFEALKKTKRLRDSSFDPFRLEVVLLGKLT